MVRKSCFLGSHLDAKRVPIDDSMGTLFLLKAPGPDINLVRRNGPELVEGTVRLKGRLELVR